MKIILHRRAGHRRRPLLDSAWLLLPSAAVTTRSSLSLVPPKRSHSKAAQGGMQASLGNVIKGLGDNEDVHFGDTVRGSDWGADQEVVRMFVNTSPKAVRELAAWGCPWSRITPGDRQVIINGEKVTITERKGSSGSR